MKPNIPLDHAIMSLTLILGVVLTAQTVTAQSSTIPWSVELYADNPDYILVKLDARSLPTNVYLDMVSFSVTFFSDSDQQVVIEKKGFRFTPQQLKGFTSGRINWAYFQQPFSSAVSVRGESLSGYRPTAGSNADTAPAVHAERSGTVSDNGNSRVLGPTPPKKN